jgi:hypothetical protein
MIGEFAYVLTARDEQNVPLRAAFANHVTVENGVSVRAIARPALDREVLIISAIWLQAQAGAGQQVTLFQLAVESVTNNFLRAIIASESGLALTRVERAYQGFGGALLIDRRHSQLALQATFDAAVNANQVQLGVSGIIIPAGNLGDTRIPTSA